ncbi:hypothetical protein DNTS_008160 [Danionella cerebrum]|uniref:Protein FAM181A n=1 Tax=Danionella cerebrum TaxID=2873325 RepID=A0A553PUV4_9TELE|nr:hypothetical protein DNTS_008160 [Danionella translucida]
MSGSDSEVKTLLNFVHLASSDIRVALERCGSARRNVDHRKYLQKHLRRFQSRQTWVPRAPEQRPLECARAGGVQRSGAHLSSLAEEQVPMRMRQLPASFWREPRSSSHKTSTASSFQPFNKQSANGSSRPEETGYVERKANQLIDGTAELPLGCACACCPPQYHALPTPLPQVPPGSRAEVKRPDAAHESAHVVIKPIPTKPSAILRVFSFI